MADFPVYRAAIDNLTDGEQRRVRLTKSGAQRVALEDANGNPVGGTGTSANQVQGTSASGAADDGSNPVKVAGIYLSADPSYAAGQRGVVRISQIGDQRVVSMAGNAIGDGVGAGLWRYTISANADLGFPAVGSMVYDGSNAQRQRGDVSGAWVHAPPATPTSNSNTIAASGGTAAVTFTNTSDTEVFNPSTATLWASWGTPAVNGAGSFPIIANGSYRPPSRVAGTLTLLSTAANQTYTSYRYA